MNIQATSSFSFCVATLRTTAVDQTSSAPTQCQIYSQYNESKVALTILERLAVYPIGGLEPDLPEWNLKGFRHATYLVHHLMCHVRINSNQSHHQKETNRRRILLHYSKAKNSICSLEVSPPAESPPFLSGP
jgi:hypothetical protein